MSAFEKLASNGSQGFIGWPGGWASAAPRSELVNRPSNEATGETKEEPADTTKRQAAIKVQPLSV